ncbi:poly(3-hydroxybutyrate) depolymerase [Caldimonas tepidiphila]|uniref:extracellular catalytic domain type 2 short-chain-length polyhydroxyalkanoate depolymerase n=1 Tax=Caldimonas tepidiphila TaxID=2315841 RepID=UPI000E5B3FA0|nr:poly(3-hydroxybutyrate) depolymerase [Caldimonas tepidiphila]
MSLASTASSRRPFPRAALRLAAALLGLLAAATPAAARNSEPAPPPLAALPALGADARAVTVSGLSSGGYMAAQFQVTHSASLAGAAVIEGGPYGCSRGSVRTAAQTCSCPSESGGWLGSLERAACTPLAAGAALELSRGVTEGMRREIDDVSNLKRHRVWLFSGGKDRTVPLPMMDALEGYYAAYGVPPAQLRRVHLPESGHGLPTKARGDCAASRTPYLNGCGFDGAGELLKWLYDAPQMQPGTARPQSLRPFSQRPYRDGGSRFDGLDETGWVYIPAACEQAGSGCRLHVAFHGCSQGQNVVVEGRGSYGRTFVEGAGYNDWAEANRIVVLYPQVMPSSRGGVPGPYRYNPKGCWDFWGYTDPRGAALYPLQPSFAKKDAPQVKAVKRMIDALVAGPSAAH